MMLDARRAMTGGIGDPRNDATAVGSKRRNYGAATETGRTVTGRRSRLSSAPIQKAATYKGALDEASMSIEWLAVSGSTGLRRSALPRLPLSGRGCRWRLR